MAMTYVPWDSLVSLFSPHSTVDVSPPAPVVFSCAFPVLASEVHVAHYKGLECEKRST